MKDRSVHKSPRKIQFCNATRLPIVCLKCLRATNIRAPRGRAKKGYVILCDYHRAVEEYVDMDKVDDNNPFDLAHFIDRIDWNKLRTGCQPELPALFKSFKRTNQEIARRVV